MQEAVFDRSPSLDISDHAGWQRVVGAIAAVLLALVFLVSGGWKVLQPFQTGELLEQAQVPAGLGTLGAAVLGATELLAAALLLSPRYRRWGGFLGSALMIFFIAWVGFYYNKLVGHECSCFPIIKRTVGPGFFIGDAVMLRLGVLAFLWSPRVLRARIPVMTFAALLAFAAVSFGVNASLRHSAVPNPVVVDGKPADLTTGKVFLFFYDPMCSHCDAASKFMSTLNWGDTRVVAIPTNDPQFAAAFLRDTKLKAGTSLEGAKLRKAFPFVDPPFGVALVNGNVKESFSQAQFNAPSPAPDLKKLQLIR
jgi:uncharacterized membrane protein YphA (DoxX/SURF4 family)